MNGPSGTTVSRFCQGKQRPYRDGGGRHTVTVQTWQTAADCSKHERRRPIVDGGQPATVDEAVILLSSTDPGYLDLDDFTFGDRVKTMALYTTEIITTTHACC